MITFSDGTQLTANEWWVFRQCMEYAEKSSDGAFTAYAVFPGKTPTASAGRKLIGQLTEKALIRLNRGSEIADGGWQFWRQEITEKGWACWRERR